MGRTGPTNDHPNCRTTIPTTAVKAATTATTEIGPINRAADPTAVRAEASSGVVRNGSS